MSKFEGVKNVVCLIERSAVMVIVPEQVSRELSGHRSCPALCEDFERCHSRNRDDSGSPSS